MTRNRYRRRLRAFPLFILAAGLILGAAVKLLWNAILPSLLGINPISYWQAVGLLALCRILFGNFGGPQGRRNRPWNDYENEEPKADQQENRFFGGPPWRNRWMNMSDEERIKLRDEMRRRCRRRPEKD